MTRKEKAKDLWDKFKVYDWDEEIGHMLNESATSDLAEAAVDEIVSELKEWGAPYLFEESTQNNWAEERMRYWEDVKAEIKKL